MKHTNHRFCLGDPYKFLKCACVCIHFPFFYKCDVSHFMFVWAFVHNVYSHYIILAYLSFKPFVLFGVWLPQCSSKCICVYMCVCVCLSGCVCLRNGVWKGVPHIQTLPIDLFDSLLMSLTCRRIAQSLTLIAWAGESESEREREKWVSPQKKKWRERISEEKVNNAGIYQRVCRNVMGWE